jgi:hypothetical protein
MTLRHRLCNLEAVMLERQIEMIQAEYRRLSDADVELIFECAEAQRTGIFRKYSRLKLKRLSFIAGLCLNFLMRLFTNPPGAPSGRCWEPAR